MPPPLIFPIACSIYLAIPYASVAQDDESLPTIPISGVAAFVDGADLTGATLEFTPRVDSSTSGETPNAQVTDEELSYLHCDVDDASQFQLSIPQRFGDCDLDVVATKWMDGDRYRWRSVLRWSEFSSKPELVFNNRGRIIVRVLGLADLPSDFRLSLRCTTTTTDAQVNISRNLNPFDKGIVLTGLDPREYEVSVICARLSKERISAVVKVPTSSPERVLVPLQLPEVRLGSLRTQVLTPEGTPASSMVLMLEPENAATGHRAVTGPDGWLREKNLPAGNLTIRCFNDSEFAPVRFKAEITADQVTERAPIRLKGLDEVYGWLQGTIKYDDDTPVPKVSCWGSQDSPIHLNVTSMDDMGIRTSFNGGQFQTRFSAGKSHVLKFEIEGTSARFQGGGFARTVPESRCLLVPVEANAGQTLQRDLVVPVGRSSEEKRAVSIRWQSPERVAIGLLAPLSDNTMWCCQIEASQNTTNHTFNNVPNVPCWAWIQSPQYTSFQYQPVGKRNTVDFDRPPGGSFGLGIDSGLQAPASQPPRAQIFAPLGSYDLLLFDGQLAEPEVAMAPFSTTLLLPVTLESDRGIWNFSGLGPGKYKVVVSHNETVARADFHLERSEAPVINLEKTKQD